MSRIIRIVAVACGLAGGVVASQAPEFSQQYRQRIGGAIDELHQVVHRFDEDARANLESRESALARLRANSDNLVSRQGLAMQANVERLERLREHRQAMADAGPFFRVALMMREGDRDVMRAAFRDYEPAIPVTEEGAVATAAGFLAVWGGLLVLAALVRWAVRRRRWRRTARQA